MTDNDATAATKNAATPATSAADPHTERDLRDAVERIMEGAGVQYNHDLVQRLVRTAVALGADDLARLDLKISAAALEEMRTAFRIFRPYADVPKVSVFGSARTQNWDPLYRQAKAAATRFAEQGWMVVTGAGPGIMEAAAEGAGKELSLGVSIRLPFEEAPNELTHGANHVAMKYFFTRKLMLMKESSGFICLPGGFGTLDEMFELLTLQQTGKAEPVPIVLLDRPGGTYWSRLKTFVTQELAGLGMISAGDMDRVLITHSVDDAVHDILSFWTNYHSIRWVGDQLIFRLRHRPDDAEIAQLNRRFGALLAEGSFERTDALPIEMRHHDVVDLPRIICTPEPRAVGSLFRVIRAMNNFRSATR